MSLLESLGMNLNHYKRVTIPYQANTENMLGEMPKDELWFSDHSDSVNRRVPATWVIPRLALEETYVLYHCRHRVGEKGEVVSGEQGKLISPLKMLHPSDVMGPNHKARNRTTLNEVKRVCKIVDQECIRKGVEINGVMTEEEARKCVQIGCPALNVPMPNVLKMKISTIHHLKRPDEYVPPDTAEASTEAKTENNLV